MNEYDILNKDNMKNGMMDCLRTMSSVLVGVYKYLPYPDFFNGSASISNCSLEIQPF